MFDVWQKKGLDLSEVSSTLIGQRPPGKCVAQPDSILNSTLKNNSKHPTNGEHTTSTLNKNIHD